MNKDEIAGLVKALLPPNEIERRRELSIQAWRDMKRDEFDQWYRARCDRRYWKYGQRCSGCDYWASLAGNWGECQRGGIVSGSDVLRSMGITFSTHIPPPGYPSTEEGHWCANFKDDFDWSILESEYLTSIGAMKDGALREKPRHVDPYFVKP